MRKARIHERGQLQTQASGFPPWEFTIAADGRFPFAVLLFLFLRIALTIFNSPPGMERAPEVSNSGSEQAQRHGNSVGWMQHACPRTFTLLKPNLVVFITPSCINSVAKLD